MIDPLQKPIIATVLKRMRIPFAFGKANIFAHCIIKYRANVLCGIDTLALETIANHFHQRTTK